MSSVDVVVPCYNYARFLPRCVDSVLRQEGVAVRVLVIDDASSDDTSDVGRQLSARDPRVHFRSHATNRGHIETFNEGLLEWSAAEYSLLLSADDALAQGALARASRLMNQHQELGMTYGMARIILTEEDENSDKLVEDAPSSNEYSIVAGWQFLKFCCEHPVNPVPTPTAVVRTEVQRRLGGYSAAFPHTGDLEMWMRFAAHSPLGVIRAVQGYYRWHGSNMGARYYNQLLGDRREFVHTCWSVLSRLERQFPAAMQWLNALGEGMEDQALVQATRAFELGELAECDAWLQFARDVSPHGRLSTKWWRLRVKKRLGHETWLRLGPVLRRLRGIPDRPVGPGDTRFMPKDGQEIGWWPEAS
jgi:glycosyltransferase involved in cell wall biosynthesis